MAKKKKNKWLRSIGLFFLIYLLGGVLLQILLIRTGNNDKYASAISFVVGLIVSVYYFMTMEDDQNAQT